MTDDRLTTPEQMELFAFLLGLVVSAAVGGIVFWLVIQVYPVIWFAMTGLRG